MIQVEIDRDAACRICGFRMEGHAGFAEEGEDIVCAAVSMLVINTINSIEQFTKAIFSVDSAEEEGGFLAFQLKRAHSPQERHDVELLLEAMYFGLQSVQEAYANTIEIFDEGGRA